MRWIQMGSGKAARVSLATAMVFLLLCGLAWASGGGEHGGEEGTRLLDLLYRAVNFTLLVIVLIVVVRKTSVKDFFANRREEIRNNFEDLNRNKALAEEKCRELELKLKEFEAGKKGILDQYRAEGVREKERIIAEAKKKAGQILEQAESTIQQEIQAARERLKREVMDNAAKQAQEILLKKMTSADHDHLVEEFIAGIQNVEKLH